MKPTLTITPALRALRTTADVSPDLAGLILDGPGRQVIATDGLAIAIVPFPDGVTHEGCHLVTPEVHDGGAFDLGSHRLPADMPAASAPPLHDLESMAGEPVYRIAFDAKRLAMIAAALGTEEVTLEFPRTPATDLIRVRPLHGDATGYLVTATCRGADGLLVSATEAPSGIQARKEKAPAAPVGPPVIRTSAERQTIEITWSGRPEKAELEKLKSLNLGFRYSGDKGTKRGVPARTWYAPDNPFSREQVGQLFNQSFEAAA